MEGDRVACSFPTYAGVAQLVEQLICNQQVGGSSPFASFRGRCAGPPKYGVSRPLRSPDCPLLFWARSQRSRPSIPGTALFHGQCVVDRRAGSSAERRFGSERGGVPKRSNGADCKSAGIAFGGSNPPPTTCVGRSEAGVAQLARASAFQAEGRGFESRLPLCSRREGRFALIAQG